MAYSLRFVGLKLRKGEYSMTPIPGEVSWSSFYCGSGFDPRLRNVHLNDGYADCFAVLSPAEVLEILAQSRVIGAELPQMQAAVRQATIVVAHVFEWETGMDID